MKKYIGVKEVCTMLGVCRRTVHRWDKSGKLKAARHPFNNRRMYRREHIEQLMKKAWSDVDVADSGEIYQHEEQE